MCCCCCCCCNSNKLLVTAPCNKAQKLHEVDPFYTKSFKRKIRVLLNILLKAGTVHHLRQVFPRFLVQQFISSFSNVCRYHVRVKPAISIFPPFLSRLRMFLTSTNTLPSRVPISSILGAVRPWYLMRLVQNLGHHNKDFLPLLIRF